MYDVCRLREAGAEIVFHGQDAVETEREARRAAEQRGAVYVSPYNDWRVGDFAAHTTVLGWLLAWNCVPGQP